MWRILSCIRDQHDPRLLLLAGGICVAVALATMTLLRHARDAQGADRARWVVVAGAAAGFGTWATHFIAMMGYHTGLIRGFALVPTVCSLLLVVGTMTIGFSLSLRAASSARRSMIGSAMGIGVAAMHYTGMMAVQMPADFRWSLPIVLFSLLLAAVPGPTALSLVLDRDDRASKLAAAALMVLGILLVHLTGMSAITLVPHRIELSDDLLLSPLQLGVAVAATALALLAMGGVAFFMSSRARAAIHASAREFEVLVQGISDCAIYMLTTHGRVASWNAGAQRLKGYTGAEAIGLELASFYSPEDREAGVPARGIEAARTHGRFNAEGWRYRKDGSRFWAHVTIEAVYDGRGEFHGFAKITRDMTRLKEDQEQLKTVAGNLDAALSSMHQGLCLFGADERLILANERAGEMFGVNPEQFPAGSSLEALIRHVLAHRTGDGPTERAVVEALARHRACIARPDGGTLVIPFNDGSTLSIAHRPRPDGGWVSTFDDITDRRRAEQRIEHMALHDGLTGLPNRMHFNGRLDEAIEAAAFGLGRIAVIGIDLDRFKEVNDAHGHSTGDAVLRTLTARLVAVLGEDEVVARFGGDEFAAFKPFADPEALDEFVARLEACVSEPIELEGVCVYSGASIGVAVFPQDGSEREQLLNNADLAMYRAKETMGRHVCFYEPGMDDAARARRVIATDLREAIARNELSILYQVQKSVRSGAVTGYEALLRWHHPRDGWISPADFIPIAEECGEILRIGEWVLRSACKDAMSWPEPWRVAVNLSPVQLMHVDLVEIVTSALVDAGLPAYRLELEITETAFIADKLRALHVLRQIKALGVSIAIDDFGTGYSSLDTLNSFPFDKIKIDKSFLLESEASHQARAIIRAVLALGRSLEVPVLAEGLESEEQLRLLQSEGCDEAQGYLWGRPMRLPKPGAFPLAENVA